MKKLKKMYVLDETLSLLECEAIIDEDGGIERYISSGEVYDSVEDCSFFERKSDGETARLQKMIVLRDRMAYVKKQIETLDKVYPADDFQFERSDYLGEHADAPSTYYKDSYWKMSRRMDLLKEYIATGYISLQGDNVKASSVDRVKWYRISKPESKSKMGVKLLDAQNHALGVTDNEDMVEVIKIIFGDKFTSYAYEVKESAWDIDV